MDDICEKSTVGSRIRMRREALGYSRSKLSETADITPQFIADIESGRKTMTVRTLMGICKGLGVSADYLLTGEDKKSDPALSPVHDDIAGSSRLLELYSSLPEQERENCIEMMRIFVRSVVER